MAAMYRLAILIIAAALLAGCAAPGQPNDTDKVIEAIGGAAGAVLPFLLLH